VVRFPASLHLRGSALKNDEGEDDQEWGERFKDIANKINGSGYGCQDTLLHPCLSLSDYNDHGQKFSCPGVENVWIEKFV
jgi:hypothetical protein